MKSSGRGLEAMNHILYEAGRERFLIFFLDNGISSSNFFKKKTVCPLLHVVDQHYIRFEKSI
jgi:hypothetical protein